MIPFTNQVCNDSFEDPKLFKSFKILEITLFAKSGLAIALLKELFFPNDITDLSVPMLIKDVWVFTNTSSSPTSGTGTSDKLRTPDLKF